MTARPRNVWLPAAALALLLASHTLPAETADLATTYRTPANSLIDAALRDEDGYRRLVYLCDRIGNRLSGSEALGRAVAWSVEEMKRAGLANVRTQPVQVPHWVRGAESGSLLAPVSRPLHLLGLGMTVGTPQGGVTADALVVANFSDLKRRGREANGKIVVFNEPYEGYDRSVAYRVTGASQAAALGAVAVLVRSITPLALQQPHTGTLRYDPQQRKIPAAAISIEDATLLDRLQQGGSTPRIHLELGAHQDADAESANVIGELPGSSVPGEFVVVGGHLDSWDVGQGAQDDGAGIMAALEAVALIRNAGLRPRRTVRVVFWVNEENGGRGGDAYRQALGDDISSHVAAIEMDEGAERPLGFGYGIPTFLSLRRARPGAPPRTSPRDNEQSLQLCRQIAQLLAPIHADKVQEGGGGSDIEPLVRDGVPSLSPVTSGEHYFDWHHTQADTVDKVNLDDFRANVALLAVLAYVLADMPGRLAGAHAASTE